LSASITAMSIAGVFQRAETGFFSRKRRTHVEPSVLADGIRYPYGPFRFKATVPKGTPYSVLVSSELTNWNVIASGTATNEGLEYVDSDASKFSHRFYRLLAGEIASRNTLGYASVTLPPGFSLIGNPLN